LEVVATVAVVAACSTVIWKSWTANTSSSTPPPAERSKRTATQQPLPSFPVSLVGAATKGQASAPVVLLAFSDFECPFCRRFAMDTLPAIDREYVTTGKVRVAFRHMPLESIHKNALQAAVAAACADAQGRFWEMHDRLFLDPQQMGAGNFWNVAGALGLDRATFSRCLRSDVVKAVRRDQELAAELAVRGTPAFFVGTAQRSGGVMVTHRLAGARKLDEFRKALDEALASAAQTSAATQ
jgi:protein-disulfide isomerase